MTDFPPVQMVPSEPSSPPPVPGAPALAPPPPPIDFPDVGRPNAFLRLLSGAWEGLRLTVRRVAGSNFQKEQATDAERAKLAAARVPVTGALTQNYAAWRRSVLWLSALALGIHVLVMLVTWEENVEVVRRSAAQLAAASYDQAQGGATSWELQEQRRQFIASAQDQTVAGLGTANIRVIDTVQLLTMGAALVGTIIVFVAAARWRSVAASSRLARIGWCVVFLAPALLALLPFRSMLDFGHLTNPIERGVIEQSFGMLFGMTFFIALGPKVVGLFPGLIRSSMTLKTLLPESAPPGWIVALIAPIYAAVLLVAAVTIYQVGGDALLLVGVVCLMFAPMVYVVRAKHISRPHGADEVGTTIHRARLTAALCNTIGVALVAVFMLRLPMVTVADAVNFGLGVLGSVLLSTLVGADLVLRLLRAWYVQSKEFVGSALASGLEQKFEALAQGLSWRPDAMAARAAPAAAADGMPVLPSSGLPA